jgi:hypothetical protein
MSEYEHGNLRNKEPRDLPASIWDYVMFEVSERIFINDLSKVKNIDLRLVRKQKYLAKYH